jgi:hypothetical protein
MAPFDTLIRRAIDVGLMGARLPLTTYELVARRGQRSDQWPPAIAFDAFEASVKEVAAKLTGDDTLATVSQLQRREVELREEALEKSARAEAEVEQAEARAEAERRRLADAERSAQQRAAAKAEAAEEQRRRKEREAAERAQKRKQASRKATAAREAVLERQATEARAEELARKETALQAKQKAVAARSAERAVDRAVRTKKAARKAG